MYVRDAKNRDEPWLLEHIEAMGLDTEAFRSRDYVIAVEEESDERVGFGRLRTHAGEPAVCELTGIGVLDAWRGQGVGAHVVERLITEAGDGGFETVYVLTDQAAYLEQFGFEECESAALPEPLSGRLDRKRSQVSERVVPLSIDIESFEMPSRLREAFKTATGESTANVPAETAEDFGIDSDSATYKYDTGR